MNESQHQPSTPSELLVATYNPGKLRELMQQLSALPLTLRGLAEFPHVAEVAETGTTFTANALLKASAYCWQTGLWTLADDSGLEVDALDGAPGVYSARYAGVGATDAARRKLLLQALARTGDDERRARFVCVIALARPGTRTPDTFTGVCAGRIAHTERGTGGFGYDPLFAPDGYEQTFGELPEEIKQIISHRARALAAVKAYLRQQL
ncbi:MAG: RdgB/HAM1 family non-canonical purine NTP pyrophosphatase [Pyrinomonadaceae bacterium]